MYLPRPFELFSVSHVGIMVFLVVAGVMAVHLLARLSPDGRLRLFEGGFALFVATQYILERAAYHHVGYGWRELLPLQMCGLSTIVTVVLMATRNRRAFEILYYWGLLGATMGMLMPEVEYDFPHPLFLAYFTGHFYPVFTVLYFGRVHGFRPGRKSLLRVFVASNACLLLMVPINLMLDTNYFYLCAKPVGSGILDFLGPWPYYIAWMEMIGILACVLAYAPFELRDRRRRTSQTNLADQEAG